MSEFKQLKQKEIEALSENERKLYYRKFIDSLKLEEKRINRELAEKKKVMEVENRKRINHAKYIIAGELLTSETAIPFLKNLATKRRFTKRHTEDLNLLMKDLGYEENIRFIPASNEIREDKNSTQIKNTEETV